MGAREQLAQRVVSALEQRLRGRSLAGVTIDTVFHYGAVDIHPRHLVVWLLLSGRPDAELPEWFFPAGPGVGSSEPAAPDPPLAADLLAACRVWAGEVREAFRAAGWPAAEAISVGFESSHRVAEGGGWFYFK